MTMDKYIMFEIGFTHEVHARFIEAQAAGVGEEYWRRRVLDQRIAARDAWVAMGKEISPRIAFEDTK